MRCASRPRSCRSWPQRNSTIIGTTSQPVASPVGARIPVVVVDQGDRSITTGQTPMSTASRCRRIARPIGLAWRSLVGSRSNNRSGSEDRHWSQLQALPLVSGQRQRSSVGSSLRDVSHQAGSPGAPRVPLIVRRAACWCRSRGASRPPVCRSPDVSHRAPWRAGRWHRPRPIPHLSVAAA